MSARDQLPGPETRSPDARAPRTPRTLGASNGPPPCTKQASEPSPSPCGSWERHSVKRNCAEKSFKATIPRVGLPVRRLALQTRRCHSLGGRPFAQPVGALPFLGWSPAGSPGDGRPCVAAPPREAAPEVVHALFPAFLFYILASAPAAERRGGPFTVLPRTQV